MNIGLSTKSLKAIMIEPAVDEQVHCTALKDVCAQQINDYYRFVKW